SLVNTGTTGLTTIGQIDTNCAQLSMYNINIANDSCHGGNSCTQVMNLLTTTGTDAVTQISGGSNIIATTSYSPSTIQNIPNLVAGNTQHAVSSRIGSDNTHHGITVYIYANQ